MLRLLEKSFELKTQDYEKQIQSSKEEIKALKDEKMQLQRQLEEERVTSDGLKGEVARLSKQAKVGLLAHPRAFGWFVWPAQERAASCPLCCCRC